MLDHDIYYQKPNDCQSSFPLILHDVDDSVWAEGSGFGVSHSAIRALSIETSSPNPKP